MLDQVKDLIAVEAARAHVNTMRAIFEGICTSLPRDARLRLGNDIERHGETLEKLALELDVVCRAETRAVEVAEAGMMEDAVNDAEFEARQAARSAELEPSSVAGPCEFGLPFEAAE
ncbi:hypothetical protein [Acuticoccus sediminis]|uniref:hypothetical protein n=1 Tax=Acuticoccus sediminis TaxID=2184697 RepID=UPI001CFCC6E6|nr:hypothetical protein [Acuticoccus sediminis]